MKEGGRTVDCFKARTVCAIGIKALIEFKKAYGTSVDTVLVELMLYVLE